MRKQFLEKIIECYFMIIFLELYKINPIYGVTKSVESIKSFGISICKVFSKYFAVSLYFLIVSNSDLMLRIF